LIYSWIIEFGGEAYGGLYVRLSFQDDPRATSSDHLKIVCIHDSPLHRPASFVRWLHMTRPTVILVLRTTSARTNDQMSFAKTELVRDFANLPLDEICGQNYVLR